MRIVQFPLRPADCHRLLLQYSKVVCIKVASDAESIESSKRSTSIIQILSAAEGSEDGCADGNLDGCEVGPVEGKELG